MESPADFKSQLSPIHLTFSSTPKGPKSNVSYSRQAQTVDFDLNDNSIVEPCRFFKSSFARSLSYHQNQTTSLDLNINSEPLADIHSIKTNNQKFKQNFMKRRSLIGDCELTNDTLLQTTLLPKNSNNNNNNICSTTSDSINHATAIVSGDTGNNNRLNVWSSRSKQDSTRMDDHQSDVNSTNVEAVILQTQVDTLQWQLKQVETSCDMYRAVMEEVARFLERFQMNANSIKIDQIARSKSMHYVNGFDASDESLKTSRTRSSTNLIDLKKVSPEHIHQRNVLEYETNGSSYNTFKDYTWRRSPKSSQTAKQTSLEQDSDKLLQEAFRLSRTINNLMNTQQPDLTQYRNSMVGQPIVPPNILHSEKKPAKKSNYTANSAKHANDVTDTFTRIFIRKMNMRESRQSVRSSTGSSVHSTSSSSKHETDEENNYSPPINKPLSNVCSTTEDESGFSSISSFQEIGLPHLNSTMLSTAPSMINGSSPLSDIDDLSHVEATCIESRNSTLKSSSSHHHINYQNQPQSHATPNTIGLPITNGVGRWDTLPASFKKNKFQRFSTLSNDDSSTVLWV